MSNSMINSFIKILAVLLMIKYYFPPCGFGFWYQLGVLDSIKENDYEIYGSSAGSIICLMYLLKKEDRSFERLSYIANQIRNNHLIINIYKYVNEFILSNYEIINGYTEDYINHKLSKIFIEVTEINFFYIFPYLKKIIKNPKNLEELKTFILASCYVPLISFYRNPFSLKINKKYYIDGFFGSLSNVSNDFIKINSYNYGTLIPNKPKKCLLLYKTGKKYNFEQKNLDFNIISFLKISLNIIIDVLLLLIDFLFAFFQIL